MDRVEARHWLRERLRGVGLVVVLGLSVCLAGYLLGVVVLLVAG